MYILRKKPKRGMFYDLVNHIVYFPSTMTAEQFYDFRKRNILYVRRIDLSTRKMIKRFYRVNYEWNRDVEYLSLLKKNIPDTLKIHEILKDYNHSIYDVVDLEHSI